MNHIPSTLREREVTPVDDVRHVREKLSAAFGNDVEKLAMHARKVAKEYAQKLGLRQDNGGE